MFKGTSTPTLKAKLHPCARKGEKGIIAFLLPALACVASFLVSLTSTVGSLNVPGLEYCWQCLGLIEKNCQY
jgi:hypothetical protein